MDIAAGIATHPLHRVLNPVHGRTQAVCDAAGQPMVLTVLMPCLNEAGTVAACVGKALGFLRRTGIRGEVVVADNGSTDGSREVAEQAGARVVRVEEKGYGAALMGGIRAARGRYVIMGDADDSYDFSRLDPFVEALQAGSQLVMGNRFRGGILPGAMPPLHRYLGNPVLSFIGRLFFKAGIGDFHCGLRGFDREAILGLRLDTPGMEFASEMVVKASLAGLRVSEVPTTLFPDGRDRPPHLRSWRDGWRHLRFLLLFSPRWLFLYPGLFLLASGLSLLTLLYYRPLPLGHVVFDINTMLYSSSAFMLGLQMCILAIYAKVFGIRTGFLPPDPRFTRIVDNVSLETGILTGLAILLGGIAWAVYTVLLWQDAGFRALDPHTMMRQTIPAATLVTAGMEVMVASFFLGILRLREADTR
jgi:glycosyltransferase involved in cell wall biosynthesis